MTSRILQPNFNYVATEATVLLVLHRTDFMKILVEAPELLNEMRKNIKECLKPPQASS
jgi:hypothetical protein